MTAPGSGATAARPMTGAVGGERHVPAPDPIARDYLLLALRLDQQTPGVVDGYFGPADLKARVDTEQLRPPARLRDDASALRDRVTAEITDPQRRGWLLKQLVALETQARALAGHPLPYREHVAACFDHAPAWVPETAFEAAAAALDAALPGAGPLPDRIAAWDASSVVPPDRLRALVDREVGRLRERSAALFGVPPGESVHVSFVTGRPWSGYNWYDGGLRSRVDLNTDLPIRAQDLLSVLSHETYFGHHLEHAWKESELVDRRGLLEASVLVLNTPECLVNEGLAEVGRHFAVPTDEEVDLLAEVFREAGLPDATDPPAARSRAERQVVIRGALADMRAVDGNVALLRHADGASREDALRYHRRWSLATPERSAKRMEFIEHPLWRTYVFVYFEGERLLARWLGTVPEVDRPARFGRLLREQLTPGAIEAEIGNT